MVLSRKVRNRTTHSVASATAWAGEPRPSFFVSSPGIAPVVLATLVPIWLTVPSASRQRPARSLGERHHPTDDPNGPLGASGGFEPTKIRTSATHDAQSFFTPLGGPLVACRPWRSSSLWSTHSPIGLSPGTRPRSPSSTSFPTKG